MKRRIKNYGIIVVVLIGLIAIFSWRGNFKIVENRQVLSSNIEEKVSEILEISTVKYNYTDIVSFSESHQIGGLNIPLTQKRFIIKYSGYLKGGVDLSSLQVEAREDNTLEILMEKPKILENVIVEEKVEIFDEKSGLFNKLSFEDLYLVLIDEKIRVEEEAISRGLLIEAEDNARRLIGSIVEEMGFENISINFR